MRTERPSKLPGYVILGSGIDGTIDSQTLFQDISAWVKYRRAFADVELLPVPGEKIAADEAIVPKRLLWWPMRLFWRLAAALANHYRRKVLAAEMKREGQFYSLKEVEARVRARQS